MATLVTNEFTSYSMTDQEIAVAQILSPEQVMYYQTMLSGYAAAKLALKYDSQDPLKSAQIEAELQGQIGVLKALLADHEEATRLQEEASQTTHQQ